MFFIFTSGPRVPLAFMASYWRRQVLCLWGHIFFDQCCQPRFPDTGAPRKIRRDGRNAPGVSHFTAATISAETIRALHNPDRHSQALHTPLKTALKDVQDFPGSHRNFFLFHNTGLLQNYKILKIYLKIQTTFTKTC